MYSLNHYPVLSCAEAAEFEGKLLGNDQDKTRDALFSAGKTIGQRIYEDYPELKPWPSKCGILVLAGGGHNAGDALVAAATLAYKLTGVQVHVLWTKGSEKKEGLVEEAWNYLCTACGNACHEYENTEESRATLASMDWTLSIDGILGMSFQPPLRSPLEETISWVNVDLNPRVSYRVAVDLPSGMGDESAEEVVAVDATYLPGIAKLPLFAFPHIEAAGRLRFCDIGFFDTENQESQHRILDDDQYRQGASWRLAFQDKRHYGLTLVLAGSPNMPGAAIMTTLGAVKSGSGLVTTFTPSPVVGTAAGHVPEAMWQPLPLNERGSLTEEVVHRLHRMESSPTSMVLGPGLVMDRQTTFVLGRIIREIHIPMVIDASALVPPIIEAVMAREPSYGPVVITPHFGEYRRLIGHKADVNDPQTLLDFSRRYKLTVVLKGTVTRLCDGESIYHYTGGSPVLARGGSGDILSGMLAVQIGQFPDSPIIAAANAVSWHGAASRLLAREHGEHAVRTTELLDYLSLALRGGMWDVGCEM